MLNFQALGTFVALDFSDSPNGLELRTNDLGNVFTWAKWEKELINQELSGTGASLHDQLKIKVDTTQNPESTVCQYNPVNRVIELNGDCISSEFTVMHEFGHFVDDEINQNTFVWLYTCERTHLLGANNCSPKQTMSEGFADGIAMIMDEMTWNVLDKESGSGWVGQYHNRMSYSNSGFRPDLQHPFVSEIILAKIMLDMWDGVNNYNHFNNTNLSSQFNDGGKDNFEMTLAELLAPMIHNTPANMADYYNALLNGDCEHDRQLKDLWHFNFEQTTLPLDNIMVMNTDELAKNRTFTHTRFDIDDDGIITGSSTYAYAYSILDITKIDNAVDNYNVTRFDNVQTNSLGNVIATIDHDFSPILLTDDLKIMNGATLEIHGEHEPEWYNQSPPTTGISDNYTHNHQDLDVQVCGNRTFEVAANGLIEVGSVSPQHIANFIFSSGSTLNLKDGTLRIHNNSHVIIEQGATLLYEPGAQIELLGSNAILEIRGNLTLADNAIFTFTGSGFVRFALPNMGGNNITVGNNCELKFVGANAADKVVEIVDGTYLMSYDLVKTSVKYGKCELGENAYWDTGNGAVDFHQATFTALDPNKPYGTIYTNGQGPHIYGTTFSYGKTGLTARNFGSFGAGLTLNNVGIHHCQVGLQSYDKGCDIYDSYFHDNETGWRQEYATFNSTWKNSTSNNNTLSGIWYEGNTDFTMLNPTLDNNMYGLVYQGNGLVKSDCGSAKNNSMWGITVTENATLDLAGTASEHTRMDISNNTVGVVVWLADYLYLKEGYNNLSPNTDANAMAVGGFLNDPTSPLKFWHNHWNENNPLGQYPNPGTSPIQGQDYNIVDLAGNANVIADANPIAYEACEGEPNERNPYILECSECPFITITGFQNTQLDAALRQIATGFYNSSVSAIETSNLLREILQYEYSDISQEHQEVLDAAWRLRKTAYAKGLNTGEIEGESIDDLSEIAIHYLADLGTRILQNPDKLLSLQKDKVLFFSLINRPILALNVLNTMDGTTERDSEWLNHFECYLEAKRDVASGELTFQELQTRLNQCPLLTLPSWTASAEKLVALSSSTNSFSLHPNPAKGEVFLSVKLAESSSIQIVIYDLAGRQVQAFSPNWEEKGVRVFPLSIQTLTAGLYQVVLRTATQTYTQKLVVE